MWRRQRTKWRLLFNSITNQDCSWYRGYFGTKKYQSRSRHWWVGVRSTAPSKKLRQLTHFNFNFRENKLCPSQYSCAGPSRQNCKSLVEKYSQQIDDGLEPLEIELDMDTHQTLKHIVLLILLLCSMFVGLAISIWTLVMEGMSGIYVELTFLDGFLNFGQSLIVLAVFISDSGDLFSPLIKVWRKLWYGANVLKLPAWEQLSPDVQHICEQFTKHHLEHCRREIAKDKR